MKIRISDIFPTITESKSPLSSSVDNSTSSSVATDRPEVSERTPTFPMPAPQAAATDRPEVSERKPTEPIQISESKPEREPGEDEAGIMGVWPPKAWSLADWVKGARGDFQVFDGLLGTKPISRGFSWRD